jgi:hypothetical protein
MVRIEPNIEFSRPHSLSLVADFLAYDRAAVALYFLFNGIAFGINVETNPNFPDLFYNNDMYGQRILQVRSRSPPGRRT